jgi:hypothetical protein
MMVGASLRPHACAREKKALAVGAGLRHARCDAKWRSKTCYLAQLWHKICITPHSDTYSPYYSL